MAGHIIFLTCVDKMKLEYDLVTFNVASKKSLRKTWVTTNNISGKYFNSIFNFVVDF